MNIPRVEVQTALVFSSRLEDVLNCHRSHVPTAQSDQGLVQETAALVCKEKGLHYSPLKSSLIPGCHRLQ